MRFKGFAALAITIIAVIGFIIWIPALKWVLLGAAIVGIIIAFGMRAWHEHKPVKDPEEESVKLHLND